MEPWRSESVEIRRGRTITVIVAQENEQFEQVDKQHRKKPPKPRKRKSKKIDINEHFYSIEKVAVSPSPLLLHVKKK